MEGKIYKIYSVINPEVFYIGSTFQENLLCRLAQHKCYYKNNYKRKYTSSKVFELGETKIELIKVIKCCNKTELDRAEGILIKELKSVNKNISGRTKKEWIADNNIQYDRSKYKENANRRVVCCCGMEVSRKSLYRHQNRVSHLKAFVLL
tara:strand:+ start:81 stop:530 length:450 start_codon:yes stop_codon:yes gene_type:complete